MTVPAAHGANDDQAIRGAGTGSSREPPTTATTAIRRSAVPDLSGFHELRIWAESFEDAQRARISCQNRMERGGIPPEFFAAQLDALKAAEHQIQLALGRCYRRVTPPAIREWQQGTFGIGEHLLARLLGALGHPRIATPYHWEGEGEDRKLIPDLAFERTVRQLWSYCGHGDAERKKRKGMNAEDAFALGSPRCKMLTHLLAEATIKTRVQPIPRARASTEPAHADTCRVEPTSGAAQEPMCGPVDPADSPGPSTRDTTANRGAAGRDTSMTPRAAANASLGSVSSADQPTVRSPASQGTADRRYRIIYDRRRARTAMTHPDWSDGHSHNDALRIIGKHILTDLWEAAQE